MDKTQTAIKELMSAYDSKHATWVEIYGNDDGFNAWFTMYISEQLTKAE